MFQPPKTISNDQAFPDESYFGLTKREYFAAAALQGVEASNPLSNREMVLDVKDVAHRAVNLADALIEALNE